MTYIWYIYILCSHYASYLDYGLKSAWKLPFIINTFGEFTSYKNQLYSHNVLNFYACLCTQWKLLLFFFASTLNSVEFTLIIYHALTKMSNVWNTVSYTIPETQLRVVHNTMKAIINSTNNVLTAHKNVIRIETINENNRSIYTIVELKIIMRCVF